MERERKEKREEKEKKKEKRKKRSKDGLSKREKKNRYIYINNGGPTVQVKIYKKFRMD